MDELKFPKQVKQDMCNMIKLNSVITTYVPIRQCDVSTILSDKVIIEFRGVNVPWISILL